MAVTITQSPQLYTPSDNPVIWVFSSDQTAQANFKFLVEVYIGGVLVENHTAYVESGIYGKFNAKSITERYSNIEFQDYTYATNMLNSNNIYIKVIEVYGNPAVNQASATSGTIKFFKARLKDNDFFNYDYDDYRIRNGYLESKFLTKFPLTEKAYCSVGENLYLSVLADTQFSKITVNTYNVNGVLLQGLTTTVGFNIQLFYGFNVGWNELLVKLPTLSLTDVEYYEVIAKSNSGETLPFRVYLNSGCTYPTKRRLHFLNTLGAFDSFTFGLISRENTNVQSFGYKKNIGEFNGGSYSINPNNGSDVDYLKAFDKQITLTSDWLTQGVQNWLVDELYTSPLILLEDNGNFKRCKITNTSYTKKIQENDMLFLEEVTLNIGSDYSVNL